MLEKINHKSAPKEIVTALITLYHQGKYDDVLSRSSQLIKEYPQTFTLHNIIGAISFEKGHKEVAIEHFRKVIELRPHHPHAYNNLGAALIDIGEYEEAKSNLKKAIELQPDYAEAYNNLGNVYKEMEEYNQAISVYEKAIELNPAYYEAYNNLGTALGKNEQYEEAEKVLKQVIKSQPDFVDGHYNLAIILSRICFKKAITQLDKILESNPNNTKLLELKADYLVEIFKIKEACIIFNKILKIEPENYLVISKILQHKKFENFNDYKFLLNKFKRLVSKKNAYNKLISKKRRSTIALIGFGRSGCLFLHSLLDGHTEISTLPGYFFKGWFNEETWSTLRPNYKNPNWKKKLSKDIVQLFEPQFNSNSKKNVIGKPCGDADWLAKSKGFTRLGDNNSESLVLNPRIFEVNFLKLLDTKHQVDPNLCFELIHDAFDLAYRNNSKNIEIDKKIFYHIHNPSVFEHLNFVSNFPHSKILYLVRNPLQMIESWLLDDLYQLKKTQNFFKLIEIIRRIINKICYPFDVLYDPIKSIKTNSVRGVRLEDIKKRSKVIIPKISNWIGIKENKTLFKSEFMGKKFSRPSNSFNNISGFDLRSIEVPIGRFFGEKDIEILETLLWPFLNTYGYTKKTKNEFIEKLNKIKPLIGQPLEFELKLKKQINFKNKKFKGMDPFNVMHIRFSDAHQTLTDIGTYPYIIKPL